jgi:hypothetical protein
MNKKKAMGLVAGRSLPSLQVEEGLILPFVSELEEN